MNREEYKKLWRMIVSFLDDFRRNPNPESLQEIDSLGIIEGAFYAGLVEEMAKEQNFSVPDWVYKDIYYLSEPLFFNGLTGDSRIITALESPLSFKTRNIFIGSNTFCRC